MGIIKEELKMNTKFDYYRVHFGISNFLLESRGRVTLTEKEIEVLANFLGEDPVLTEDYMFNSIVRKRVMERMKLSPGGLGNHLKQLVIKGFLIRDSISNRLKVNKKLLPAGEFQGYMIKLRTNGVKK